MQTEIEAKFLNVNHDEIRKKLKALGAICEQPMRLMRRTLFDYPDHRFQQDKGFKRLRVRDENNKVTVTYKYESNSQYHNEIETTIGSYETMVQLFEAIGLEAYSAQESKRETWHYKESEVVLDEWPWLNSYIEIEGPNEAAIQAVAKDLGFEWKDAKFGSVDTAYRAQYPGIKEDESIGDIPEVSFGVSPPEYLKSRL